MKKNPILLLLIATALVLGLVSLQSEEGLHRRASDIYAHYLQRWDTLSAQTQALHRSLQQPEPNPAQVQALHLAARLTYKEIAWIAAYIDPEYQADYINGAPLPKLERNFSQVNALSPKGFQPLEEWVFEENYTAEMLEAARQLSLELQLSVSEFGKFNPQRKWHDYMVVEALRHGLVRFAALDLVGFDVPASGAQLAELQAAWKGMEKGFSVFSKDLSGANGKKARQLKKLFAQGRLKLSAESDFDQIDRLFYLRQLVNPLFAGLLELQTGLGLPHATDLLPVKTAFNFKANNLFANDILNPYYYTQMVPAVANQATVSLGKLLFFDPVLSSTNERACASCHQPEKGFTDGLPKSLATGFNGTVQRNAPTLLNSVYSPRFFWDMRVQMLENQFAHVVVSEQEFNTSVMEVMERLNQSDEYRALFNSAFPSFGNNAINQYTINTALAAYVASLRGFNSPFDRYVRGELTHIAPEVQHGFNLFMGKALCGTCHFAPSFGGIVPPLYQEQESEVLGVPAQAQAPYSLDADKGRGAGLPKEQHPIYHNAFKTVTVRNAALTAPYMHNGVYQTLEEVVEFYHQGGGAGLGLEVPNQTLPFDSLSLSAAEKKALVAFMQSLTDTSGLTQRPLRLPAMNHNMAINERKIGGLY